MTFVNKDKCQRARKLPMVEPLRKAILLHHKYCGTDHGSIFNLTHTYNVQRAGATMRHVMACKIKGADGRYYPKKAKDYSFSILKNRWNGDSAVLSEINGHSSYKNNDDDAYGDVWMETKLQALQLLVA